MTDRSVAEIIGWHVDAGEVGGGYGAKIRTPDGRSLHMTAKPTPDDMLAWLREQEASTYHHGDTVQGFDAGLASSTHRLTVVKAGLHTIRVEAPTLHAALEAAVRAVGDAT